MTYVHRIRKPKVGTFTSMLRQLSQDQLLSLYELPTRDRSSESEPVRLPSSRRRAFRQASS